MTTSPSAPPKGSKRKPESLFERITTPGLYLLAFAFIGWIVLIANMFGLAGSSGWIFPVVQDIAGLAASTVFFALIGLTPLALRQWLGRRSQANHDA